MNTFSVTEMLMHCTVRIECLNEDMQVISTGTGFIMNFIREKGLHLPIIITNKHVITGGKVGRICFTAADDNGNPLYGTKHYFFMENFEEAWIKHPKVDVDLCVLPISGIHEIMQKEGNKIFYMGLEKGIIPTQTQVDELTAIEEITMIGYPNGLWDETNNLPIFRRGITATHPRFDYNGKQEFLIDAACFPGSSGSPVFLLNIGSYANKSGKLCLGTRGFLLGVLYAGPQHIVEGELHLVKVATSQKPIALTQIPNNLGFVIRSSELLVFEDILRREVTAPNNR